MFVMISSVIDFNPNLITSGVYRRGDREQTAAWRNLFYEDGRTATVSAHIGVTDGVVVLATNGKPDATLGPRWLGERVEYARRRTHSPGARLHDPGPRAPHRAGAQARGPERRQHRPWVRNHSHLVAHK